MSKGSGPGRLSGLLLVILALLFSATAVATPEPGNGDLAAPQTTAEAWTKAGDGPGQMAALAGMARLLAADQPAEAAALLKQILLLGRSEERRPLAAAHVLHDTGKELHGQHRLEEARQFWAAALA